MKKQTKNVRRLSPATASKKATQTWTLYARLVSFVFSTDHKMFLHEVMGVEAYDVRIGDVELSVEFSAANIRTEKWLEQYKVDAIISEANIMEACSRTGVTAEQFKMNLFNGNEINVHTPVLGKPVTLFVLRRKVAEAKVSAKSEHAA